MKNLFSIMAFAVVFGLFVTSCEDEEEKIQSIEIESSKKVYVGDKGVLDISYTPNYLSVPICNWTSSDSSIVEIDCYTGEYIVKNVGTAIITVATSDFLLTDQCQFKSSLYRDFRILSMQNCSLYENESTILEIDSYWDTENDEWLSTDNSIAIVDENGKVTAVGEGVCYIVLVTSDNFKDYCKVTVKKFYEVDTLVFDVTEKEIELGENFTLTALITPNNSSNKYLQWSSSDSTIAKVDDYGTVYSVNEGVCYIYAKSHNDKVAECRVVVLPASIKSAELNLNEIKLMPGESQEVGFSITPSYAKITDIEWSVEDEAVASVTSDGVVTCNSIGSTKLKLILNEEISVECNIVGCEIDEFVEVIFGGGSIMSINGYITGNIGFYLVNNSNSAINANKIQIIDGYTGWVSISENLNDIVIDGKSRVGYSARLNSIYKPIFRFYYSYNNKEYYTEKYGI